MKDPIRILVSSAGTAAAVNIIKGLKMQSLCPVKIFAMDINPYAPGLFLADQSILAPRFDSPSYIDFLVNYCTSNQIEAYFSGYSKELEVISRYQDKLRQNGIKTLISDYGAMLLCNDKVQSANLVGKSGFDIPEIINSPQIEDLPIFVKPISGSGSDGAYLASDKKGFLGLRELDSSKFLFQEYIEGEEYTVDVLCDSNSKVLFCGPRIRKEVKAGLAVKSVTVDDSKLVEITRRCCELFNVRGVCNLQFIKRHDHYYFIEINPRFAAACILTIYAGANLPLAALNLMLDLKLDVELEHQAGKVMSRYWEEIII